MADATVPERLLEGLKDAAERAGWGIEWNFRDHDDETGDAYDLYLWPRDEEEQS